MNYFAHACVAARFDARPAFVLGAMLPDFAGMIGARIRRLEHPALGRGESHHHQSDRAFHRAATFRELVMAGARRLDREGVSRGPARGAAHVGVELLFDGALLGEAGADAAYLDALGEAPELDAAIRWNAEEAPGRWERLRLRLRRAGLPHALRDPEQVAARVTRALAPRPGLRLAKGEAPAVARWLRDARAEVVGRAPALLEETLAGLREVAAPGPR